jgi:histidyl-tRNA synthetase
MSEKIQPRLLKGFRDYGPELQIVRSNIFKKIKDVFVRFGFLPMATPVLEYKDILMGKYGEDEKLIYSFKDNGERDVAMRYDLTVPLARFIAQNKNQLTFPFKRYQIAPVWRADNPQKGRLREFYQCDIDAVGTNSELADAEVIVCVCQVLDELGVTDYELRVNNRKIFDTFTDILQADTSQVREIIRAIDKVNKIGKAGVLEILREKNIPQTAIEQVDRYLDLGTGAAALGGLYEQVASGLKPFAEAMQSFINLVVSQGVAPEKILFDPSIARGLDYYTGVVFEVVLKNKPEFGSVASGGRYDNLVDQFSNESLPAVGGSIGIDRLLDALQELGLVKMQNPVKALVLNMDAKLQTDYVQLVSQLREAGINSELYYESAKLDKQFKYAEGKGIEQAIIMGEAEQAAGTVKIKNIKTRQQTEVSREDLLEALQN